jgi:hypothetical protein
MRRIKGQAAKGVPEGLWEKCEGLRCGAVSAGTRCTDVPEVWPPPQHRSQATSTFFDQTAGEVAELEPVDTLKPATRKIQGPHVAAQRDW